MPSLAFIVESIKKETDDLFAWRGKAQHGAPAHGRCTHGSCFEKQRQLDERCQEPKDPLRASQERAKNNINSLNIHSLKYLQKEARAFFRPSETTNKHNNRGAPTEMWSDDGRDVDKSCRQWVFS